MERFRSYSGHADEASYHGNNNRPIGQSSTSTSDMLASVHLKMANFYVDLPTASIFPAERFSIMLIESFRAAYSCMIIFNSAFKQSYLLPILHVGWRC